MSRSFRAVVLFAAVISFPLISARAVGQSQCPVWYVGDRIGIDFRTKPPSVRTDFGITQLEGTSIACDSVTGNVLFYTNGVVIADRTHAIMPNGSGLLGHNSSTQSALVIPMPGRSGWYYVFTSDQEGNAGGNPRGHYYSTVDMSLRGGLGDVVQKNVPMPTPVVMSERLTAIKRCDIEGYWVITHSRNGNHFYSWPVAVSGVGAPVASLAGPVLSTEQPLGALTPSHNGLRLVMTARNDHRVDLLEFDPASGVVSGGPNVYLGSGLTYDAAFSPDDRKLYYGVDAGFFQCDITGSQAEIASSTIRLNSTSSWDPERRFFGVEEGPDGRIYAIANDIYNGGVLQPWVSGVDFPNGSGFACGFRDSTLPIPDRRLQIGLPNITVGRLECVQPDTGIAFTFYAGEGCTGSTDRLNVPFDAWYHSDTVRSISFEGANADLLRLDTVTPIFLPATRPVIIPLLWAWGLPGPQRVVMVLNTAAGYSHRILIKGQSAGRVDSLFSMATIGIPNGFTGDTCVPLRNVYNRSLRVRDTTWLNNNGRVRLRDLALPGSFGTGATVNLCLHVDPGGLPPEFALLVGVDGTDSCAVPFCAAHVVRFLAGAVIGSPVARVADDGAGELLDIRPNPVEDESTVDLTIRQAGMVRIDVVDMRGACVATLADRRFEAGLHSLLLSRMGLASGVYALVVAVNRRVSRVIQFVVK